MTRHVSAEVFDGFSRDTIVAAQAMQAIWTAKLAMRTHLFLGKKALWKAPNSNEPRQKLTMDIPDFIQRSSWPLPPLPELWWLICDASPRPR